MPAEAGTSSDFIDSLRPAFGNYDAARSVSALANRSERIAVGTIAALREGRPLEGEAATVVLELEVSEVLKGEPAERLYVELYNGLVFDAPNVPDPLPDDRLLLFLVPDPKTLISAPDEAVIDNIAGLPDGEPLYSPTTPQGLMVELPSGLVDAVDLVVPGSFEALIESLRE